jgi:hypothetical protein
VSDRNETIQQAVMAGFQMGNGSCIKVKYYFTNFHNEDFSETRNIDGADVSVKPYEGLKANILQLSLGFALFKDETLVYKR